MTSKEVNICSICYNEVTDPATPNICTHTFCYQCILKWSRNNNVCPFCRIKFNQLLRYNPPV